MFAHSINHVRADALQQKSNKVKQCIPVIRKKPHAVVSEMLMHFHLPRDSKDLFNPHKHKAHHNFKAQPEPQLLLWPSAERNCRIIRPLQMLCVCLLFLSDFNEWLILQGHSYKLRGMRRTFEECEGESSDFLLTIRWTFCLTSRPHVSPPPTPSEAGSTCLLATARSPPFESSLHSLLRITRKARVAAASPFLRTGLLFSFPHACQEA